MVGERLGRFELVSHLASGGMANVFLARVAGLAGFERHVVLKTLTAHDLPDESYIGMFLDEARLAASLHHQHVAQVYEVGCTDETYFLAMEYVHGKTVRSVLEAADERRLTIPLEFSLSVVAAAAAGLHHAHERCDSAGAALCIVHRDVSPSNVLVSYDGSTKLIDFGIAKANARVTHTKTGFIKGKAGYMAPEQARGYEVDRRSDVFALGIVAYELVTQHRAFDAPSEFERIEKIVNGDIPPPSYYAKHVSPELDLAIMTALAVDPDDRYDTADDMRVAVEAAACAANFVLGSAPVARLLAKLFGRPREPWMPRPERVAVGSGQHETFPEPADDTRDITLPLERDLVDDGPANPLSTVQANRSAASTIELRPRAGTIKPTMAPPRQMTASPPVVVGSELAPMDGLLDAPLDVPGVMISDAGLSLPSGLAPLPRAQTDGSERRASVADRRQVSLARVEAERRTPIAQPHEAVALRRDPPRPRITGARPAIIDRLDTPRPTRTTQPSNTLVACPTSPVLAPTPIVRGVTIHPHEALRTSLKKQIGYVVLGGLVLGLAVGLIASFAAAKHTATAPKTAAPTTRVDAERPPPSAVSAPVELAPVAPTQVAPLAFEVNLVVTSDPKGATVVLDGERLGKTPLELKIPRRAKDSWLKVRMQKFNATKIRVSRDRDITWRIQLQPVDE